MIPLEPCARIEAVDHRLETHLRVDGELLRSLDECAEIAAVFAAAIPEEIADEPTRP